jgi:hypothetical protein
MTTTTIAGSTVAFVGETRFDFKSTLNHKFDLLSEWKTEGRSFRAQSTIRVHICHSDIGHRLLNSITISSFSCTFPQHFVVKNIIISASQRWFDGNGVIEMTIFWITVTNWTSESSNDLRIRRPCPGSDGFYRQRIKSNVFGKARKKLALPCRPELMKGYTESSDSSFNSGINLFNDPEINWFQFPKRIIRFVRFQCKEVEFCELTRFHSALHSNQIHT